METKNENTMGGGMEKKCNRCGKMLPIENFGTYGKYGAKHVCKECEHESRKKGAESRKKGAESRKKGSLSKFSKEELVAELQRRGLKIMASPTPREMMLKLKAMGYDGDLKYTEVKTINLSKLE